MKEPSQTDDATLISALRTLAVDIQSDDGIANSVVFEAAQRIEDLHHSIDSIRDAVLHERYQLAEAGLDCDQVNCVLGVIDDFDARVMGEER